MLEFYKLKNDLFQKMMNKIGLLRCSLEIPSFTKKYVKASFPTTAGPLCYSKSISCKQSMFNKKCFTREFYPLIIIAFFTS